MPPCDAAYLVGIFYEIGPTMPGSMGNAPIPHSEIASWQSNTGITLSHWESATIRRLSIDYLSECSAAEKPDCEAPFPTPEYEYAVRHRRTKAMKENLQSLSK